MAGNTEHSGAEITHPSPGDVGQLARTSAGDFELGLAMCPDIPCLEP